MARWIILEPETARLASDWVYFGMWGNEAEMLGKRKREIKDFNSRLIRIFVYWLNIGTILHGCCHTKVQPMWPVQVFSLSRLHSYLYPCNWTLSNSFVTLFEFTEVLQEVHTLIFKCKPV